MSGWTQPWCPKRADDAHHLVTEKAETKGLELSTVATAETDLSAMPQRTLPTGVAGTPKPQVQRDHRFAEGLGYTDPDSHIVKGSAGWNQGYNVQANVKGNHHVIMATSDSNQPSGAVHLLPMLERIQSNTGQVPDPFLADAGYSSTAKLKACDER